MHTIDVAAVFPTFAEYQLIHQTQERRRYPEPSDKRKPATSDSWLGVWQRWLGIVLFASGATWFFNPSEKLGEVVVFSLFTGLGLLYQRWEYRRAFQEYKKRQLLSYNLSTAGITIEWPQDRQFIHWKTPYCVQLVSHWLLLYPGPDYCYYLDLRQVLSPYTTAQVLALISWLDVNAPAATFAAP